MPETTTTGASGRPVGMSGAVLAVAVGLGAWTAHRVRAETLDLTTCLMLIGACASLAIGAALLAPVARSTRLGLSVSIVTTAVLVAAAEMLLRSWSGSYSTYLERSEGRSYELQYHHTSPARYLVFAPNASYTHERSEFAFPRTTNSLGLPEHELPPGTAPDEFRLLALGDSYTEGVGTSYDQTWLKVVEHQMASALPDRAVTSYNAGVSGSDPWYELTLLDEKLRDYRFDLVLVAINASDVNDVIVRGGRERFGADGITRPRPTPWWEWLYGVSFLARHVVHDLLGYNALFIRNSAWLAARREACQQLLDAVAGFQALANRDGYRLVIVIHPDKQEAARARYERVFAEFVDAVKAQPGLLVVDVLERWKAAGALAGGSAARWYWPIDGHHTPEGYAAFGNAVADAVVAGPGGLRHGASVRSAR